MKKFLSFSLIALFSVSVMAQNRAQVPAALRNYAVKSPVHPQKEAVATNYSQALALPHSKAFAEEEIGSTYYDLMTNRSCYNRTYLYGDGTVAAIWTMAQTSNYSDRGTGYNYNDGTAWGALPSSRIESVRTGFPSYSPLGAGEVVIAHNATNLYMSQRAAKGTGVWTEMNIPYNVGTEPTWPRVCVNGNSIHAICVDYTATKLLYFRSTDGGTTWDKQGDEIPGLEMATYYPNGFDADCYDWADPVNGTIAFLIGDKASDLILMKSIDDGNTWTKTLVFQHPYPMFNEATTLTPDTPYVVDASHAICLDNSGNAYVAFGISRFLNDDTTDGTYSWFPGVDGVGFWKEGQPAFTSVNPDDVYGQCKLIGYLQDIDGSGVVLDNYTSTSIADYQVSTTSMPQITIGSDGHLYMIFRSLVETQMSGTGQFYSHIWGRKSMDGGDTWTDFIEITGGIDHEMVECVYPSLSPATNGMLRFTYMQDFEPGTSLGSDADPVGYNSIYYATIDFADFGTNILNCTVGLNEVSLGGNFSIYPNPVADFVNVNYNSAKSSDVVVNFYNAVGSLVKSEAIVTERGSSNQISTKDLASGIYLVKMVTPTGTYSQKIIKN